MHFCEKLVMSSRFGRWCRTRIRFNFLLLPPPPPQLSCNSLPAEIALFPGEKKKVLIFRLKWIVTQCHICPMFLNIPANGIQGQQLHGSNTYSSTTIFVSLLSYDKRGHTETQAGVHHGCSWKNDWIILYRSTSLPIITLLQREPSV